MLRETIYIALGGGVGALSRFWIALAVKRSIISSFPFATLMANMLGCFLLGFLMQIATPQFLSKSLKIALATGFLGSLTTFSTFGYESFSLLENGKWLYAGLNIFFNLIVGMVMVWVGVKTGRMTW